MVIRVWDFILIGLIRDEKSSPPRLTYLALLRFTQIFFASKRCWAEDKFCLSRPFSPHISLNARVCVCIHYHFQKAYVFSFSFGAVTITFFYIFHLYLINFNRISKTSPTYSKPGLYHGATHDPTTPHPIVILLNCDLINLT